MSNKNLFKKREKFVYKGGPTKGILLKGVFIPKLLNIPLAFSSLINFDFLLSHIAHFDKSIILSVFFLHFKQYDNIVL